jgi:hypothetical protein
MRRLLALSLALASVLGTQPASTQGLEWATIGADRVTVIATLADTEVRITDVDSGTTLARETLALAGDAHILDDPPFAVRIQTTRRVLVQTGRPQLGVAHGSALPSLEGDLGPSFWAVGPGVVTVVASRPLGQPDPALSVFRTQLETLDVGDAAAVTDRHAIFDITGLSGRGLALESSVPATAQRVVLGAPGQAWAVAVRSTRGEAGVVSRGAGRTRESLAVYAPYGGTVTITDLSDGDDTAVRNVTRNGLLLAPGPWVDRVEATGPVQLIDPLDDDVFEVSATLPVLVVTGAFGVEHRGAAIRSAPLGPLEWAALVPSAQGELTLLGSERGEVTITTLVAGTAPPSPTEIAPEQWRGGGPFYATAATDGDAVLLVRSTTPFVAFLAPAASCCGPWFVPSLPPAGPHGPVARAGADRSLCSLERVVLSAAHSFDPEGGEVALTWDLDTDANSDGVGTADDDVDASGVEALLIAGAPGETQIRLTATGDDMAVGHDNLIMTVVAPSLPRCGSDADNDGVGGLVDNCPDDANADQRDIDGDGAGDTCDPDLDGDDIGNDIDVCPSVADPEQADLDEDGDGDACDLDVDGDGVEDVQDNCPRVFNRNQVDTDGDGDGDLCDGDIDGDSWANDDDNCPTVPNQSQTDTDGDGAGDLCDVDDDSDGVPDRDDNCVVVPNPNQLDVNNNGVGDACEPDRDEDGAPDSTDNCPSTANPGQEDLDGDGDGDVCDADIDGDAVGNVDDNCPEVANADQTDVDENGVGDVCERDSDGDGVPDHRDVCPDIADGQEDLDGDGLGDVCDPDLDGDGLDVGGEQSAGTRADDADTDADGLSDGVEVLETRTNPTKFDTDADGLSDGVEYDAGSNPLEADSDGDGVEDGQESGWNEDSDGDGRINAMDTDADNGGVSDGIELTDGTNMLDPTDDGRGPPAEPAPTDVDAGCGVVPAHSDTSAPTLRLLIAAWGLPSARGH